MHIKAHLDVDVVALEIEDQVSVLVELTAPLAVAPKRAVRPARTVQVVLDRSGSMQRRMDGAISALVALVDRLDPVDRFGLVAFDDRVELIVSAGTLGDKPSVKQAIAGLTARGTTDLSAGYLRGLQEARRVAGDAGAVVPEGPHPPVRPPPRGANPPARCAVPAGGVPRRADRRPGRLGGEGIVLHGSEMLEQAAEGQRGGAGAGLQPCRVEVVSLPAEGRAQAVQRTDEVLDLGAGNGRFPRGVIVGHGVTVEVIADVPRPGSHLSTVGSQTPVARRNTPTTHSYVTTTIGVSVRWPGPHDA